MKISIKAEGLERFGDFIGMTASKFDTAAARAINRTIDGTLTLARRTIAAQTHIKPSRIKRRLVIRKAARDSLNGAIWVGVLPFPAAWIEPIRPKGMNPRQQRKMAGATAGGGKFNFPGAFVARMPNGKLGIFQRQSPARSSFIEKTLTADQLGIANLEQPLSDYAEDRLERELSHELGRLLGVSNG
ncbi:phage tail protein [Methylomagnum ishizawai]|uniref:phage tail protein n=1 Tax=Methylomagnum ishizawai TaxID=1760988 RepID=UPI001C31FDB4|nr:phage tail protein [Methylomagnum ishizawai]BBL75579.1 hypothetical protein MishRS11D_26770 [Methylomagnum ishizawai]